MARNTNRLSRWGNTFFSLFDLTPAREETENTGNDPMVTINVCNKKDFSGIGEYIGRGKNPTPCSNPFRITPTQDRATSIARYKKWFLGALKLKAPQQTEEIERLFKLLVGTGELNLVCHCAPEPCHGDVIKAVLLRMYDNYIKKGGDKNGNKSIKTDIR